MQFAYTNLPNYWRAAALSISMMIVMNESDSRDTRFAKCGSGGGTQIVLSVVRIRCPAGKFWDSERLLDETAVLMCGTKDLEIRLRSFNFVRT